MLQNTLNRGLNSRRNFLVSSLVVFVVLITVITLMFSTRQVTKGYVLNKLDAQHQRLVMESEQREMQISEVRSMDYLKGSPQIANMRRPDTIVFLNADTAIASR